MENEIEVVRTEAAGIADWANRLVVQTKDDYQAAVGRLQEIKAIRKRWTDYWAPVKASAHEAWKGIVAKEKAGTDICDRAEQTAKTKALAWAQAEQEKQAAEQRKLQAQADEAARRERERLEREAAKLKTPEKIQERLEQAAAVQAPVITLQTPTAGVKGASTRTTWKARVVDMSALIAAATPGSVAASLLAVNQSAADAFARSTKGAVPVPGIEFYPVSGLSIGGRTNEREGE